MPGRGFPGSPAPLRRVRAADAQSFPGVSHRPGCGGLHLAGEGASEMVSKGSHPNTMIREVLEAKYMPTDKVIHLPKPSPSRWSILACTSLTFPDPPEAIPFVQVDFLQRDAFPQHACIRALLKKRISLARAGQPGVLLHARTPQDSAGCCKQPVLSTGAAGGVKKWSF